MTFSPTPWLSVKTFSPQRRRDREVAEKNKNFFFWVLNLKNTFGFDFGCLGGLGAFGGYHMVLTVSPTLLLPHLSVKNIIQVKLPQPDQGYGQPAASLWHG
jgi:hypothetical protein